MFSILALSAFQLMASRDAAPSRLAEIRGEIQEAEYRFSPVPAEEGVWSAPNRSQELRSRISPFGLEVCPRQADASGDGASWKLALRTASFGRTGDARALGYACIRVEGGRLELDHGHLTEWFENRPEGIEQGWTISAPPIGADPLWIGLAVQGDLSLRIDDDGRAGVFVDGSGEPRLRYRDLRVWDAEGRELEAILASSPAGPGIRIRDQGAVYPLTVDPVLTGPAWTAEGDQAGAIFGISVAAAGDVNGDGFGDVIVGAFWYDNGQMDEGRAYLYLGSAAGLSPSADWTAESNQHFARFGASVAAAGDVNGDGYGDVIVGAYWYDNGQADEGRAFLYLGSAAGLSSSADWTAESDQVDAFFGTSVATAGDVNGDGYSDVIIGADSAGRAFSYLGSAAGLSTSAAWTAHGQPLETFGHCVSTAGDVNGDGYSDVIVGSFEKGRVYLGSAAGLSPSAAWTAESDQSGSLFGYSVATAGDVNGDGFGDVIVGAYGYDDQGRAFLYLGSAAGLSGSAAWVAEGDQVRAHFGYSVATAGDMNGDGFGDVVVGAPGYDNGQTHGGRAFLYLGSAAGLSTNAAWTAEGDRDGASFGQSVAMAGDVNGDGYGDVIVGAPSYSNGQAEEGRAFLYLGSEQLARIVLDFETDDEGQPLVHGQHLGNGDPEFDGGSLFPVTITSSVNASGSPTAAILDSSTGPAAQDPDLLVGAGNILILQTDANTSECPPGSDVYCSHNDDEDGGRLSFTFDGSVSPVSVVLIDVDATDGTWSVVLTDANGAQRIYAVPASWTGDLVGDGPPGSRMLNLTHTNPQPGFGAIATASEDVGFELARVAQIDIHVAGSGGVDDLSWFTSERDLPRAASAIRNGSGVNPMNLASATLPVLGGTWVANLDCTLQGSGVAVLVVRRHPTTRMTPVGEVLVRGAVLHRESRAHPGSVVQFAWDVPGDLALLGLDAHVQGRCNVITGSGVKPLVRHGSLSNAIDLIVGF